MKPEPTPVAGTENGPNRVFTDDEVIVTTAGLTFAATSTTASEESRWTTLVVVLVEAALFEAPVPEGRRSAAVPTEARLAETSETATTGTRGQGARRQR